MRIIPFGGYSCESGKRQGGFHCWRRLCRQKVTVLALTPFDRIAPMATAEHRDPATPSMFGNGFADANPLRLIAVPPCSLSLLPDKDFFDRPATCRLIQQSRGRDSDNPPSCVAGLSQTRPAGTGQFQFTGIDEESDMGDRRRQFHLSILYGIPLLCRNSRPKDSVRSHRLLSLLVVLQIL